MNFQRILTPLIIRVSHYQIQGGVFNMDEQGGFTVKDKRRFTEGPEEAKEEAKEETKAETGHEEKAGAHGQAHGHKEDTHAHPVEINFASFVFSIASSAFIHLGEEPDPLSGEKKVSLPMAKQTIDVLSMLEEKTKGNLNQDEDHLLKNILYTLRMKYVEATSKK